MSNVNRTYHTHDRRTLSPYESEELDEEPLDEESSIDYDNDDFEI